MKNNEWKQIKKKLKEQSLNHIDLVRSYDKGDAGFEKIISFVTELIELIDNNDELAIDYTHFLYIFIYTNKYIQEPFVFELLIDNERLLIKNTKTHEVSSKTPKSIMNLVLNVE